MGALDNIEERGKVMVAGSTPSFSLEDELNKFKAQLDGNMKVTLVIPGYLFRDGRDRRNELTQFELRRYGNWGWGGIDENLLKQHAETYRRAMEAHRQLLYNIRPIEILEIVRKVWSRGETKQKAEEGAILTYSYLIPTAQREGGGHWIPERSIGPLGNSREGGYRSSGVLTGKWGTSRVQMTAEISVGFGSIKYPTIGHTYTQELNEFFADHYYYSNSHSEFPYTPLPQQIWRRPDNLVILISVPSPTPEPTGQAGYIINNVLTYCFDQSTSQQEIIDRLSEQLEAQKKMGKLPPQLEALELAKIEELRRRGLFIEPTR